MMNDNTVFVMGFYLAANLEPRNRVLFYVPALNTFYRMADIIGHDKGISPVDAGVIMPLPAPVFDPTFDMETAKTGFYHYASNERTKQIIYFDCVSKMFCDFSGYFFTEKTGLNLSFVGSRIDVSDEKGAPARLRVQQRVTCEATNDNSLRIGYHMAANLEPRNRVLFYVPALELFYRLADVIGIDEGLARDKVVTLPLPAPTFNPALFDMETAKTGYYHYASNDLVKQVIYFNSAAKWFFTFDGRLFGQQLEDCDLRLIGSRIDLPSESSPYHDRYMVMVNDGGISSNPNEDYDDKIYCSFVVEYATRDRNECDIYSDRWYFFDHIVHIFESALKGLMYNG